MRTYGLFGAMLLLLTACGTFQEETGLSIFSLGDTPAQPSSDQVVLALHERVEREPMLLCPGVSLTASCEWIEQGNKGALFPPEIGIRVASPLPLVGIEFDAAPSSWEICYRLEGSDTLYLTELSSEELGIKAPVETASTAGVFDPYYATVRAYHLGEPGYDAVANRCDGALTNRGQKASAW